MLAAFTKIQKKITAMTPLQVFLLFSLIGSILYFPFLLIRPFGELIGWLSMENNENGFAVDYCVSFVWSLSRLNVYIPGSDASFYPPLAILISKVFSYASCAIGWGSITGPEAVLTLQNQILMIVLYSLFSCLLLCFAISETELRKKERVSLFICILLSTPYFTGALWHMNAMLYCFPLLILWYIWKDSDNRAKREASLIFLALSAGIKIFPAIFGLFYIKEKKWSEAFRLIGYGILFLVVPFLFMGGYSSFKVFVNALLSRTDYDNNEIIRYQFISGLLTSFHCSSQVANIASKLFVIGMLALFFVSKSKTRALTFLSAVCVFYPASSYRYQLLYFFVVILSFAYDTQANDPFTNYSSALLLSQAFTIPTIYGIFTDFKWTCTTYADTYVERYIYGAAYVFLLVTFIYELFDLIKRWLYHHKNQRESIS